MRYMLRTILMTGVVLWVVAAEAFGDEPDTAAVDRVLSEKPADMMLKYFQGLASKLAGERTAPKTRDEWERRRVELRRLLWQSLGEFPLDSPPPLRPRVRDRLDHGDHWVEKIVYESLPGLYVTALMYLPKKVDGPLPAVICVNGHWTPAKATPDIQRRCAGLARMGVVAFCQDVIGTGERAAPSDSPHSTYHGNYRGAAARIVDRSLLGYIMYECRRAVDYLESRPEVDPRRIMCTGASGGGKQSMFFAALDERLAGAVPVCYISSYETHMGATACVGEIPTGVLRYTEQWEILGLHAPRPLLAIAAAQDSPVFLPKHTFATLARTRDDIYRLYGAEDKVRAVEFDSPHAYNGPMRELLYNHVAHYLLGVEEPRIVEPDDLPVETPERLACGLPGMSETLASLTFRRAQEMASAISRPADAASWREQKGRMLRTLEMEILGGSADRGEARHRRARQFAWKGREVEHWILETEPGVLVPAVLCAAQERSAGAKAPVAIVIDEDGKRNALDRGLIEQLSDAGWMTLAIDFRGAGETDGTVPVYQAAQDYNLANYSLFVGRPLPGMRVHDIRCAVDLLRQRDDVDTGRIAVVGRGMGGFCAMLAAALDERISAVATEEMLATWVFSEEFDKIGLSYLIPRILEVGDVSHLAACVAPRPLLVLNPVDGRRRMAGESFPFAKEVYALEESGRRFSRQQVEPSEAPARLVDWLGSTR